MTTIFHFLSMWWTMFFAAPSHFLPPDTSIRSVRVTVTIPIIDSNSSRIFDKHYDVYHKGKYCIYRITMKYNLSVNGKHILSENRYEYFAFSTDSSYGIYHAPKSGKEQNRKRRLPVDSILALYHSVMVVPAIRERQPDSVYHNPGKIIKVFIMTDPKTSPETFTYSYFYSTQFLNYSESLDSTLDLVDGKKLYKIVIRGHGAYYNNYHFYLPSREYVFKLGVVPKTDIEIAKGYLTKYAQYITKKTY